MTTSNGGYWNSNNSIFYTITSLHPFASEKDARKRVKDWPLRTVEAELAKMFAAVVEDTSSPAASVMEQRQWLAVAAAYERSDLSEELLVQLADTGWGKVLTALGLRRDLPEELMIQLTLDGLAKLFPDAHHDAFPGTLRDPRLPPWVMNAALNLHVNQRDGMGELFYRLLAQILLTNPALPLEVRARLVNPEWVSLTSEKDAVFSWVGKDGKLKESYCDELDSLYPELLDLPVGMLVGVLATIPVTRPEWCQVPARWAGQVAKFATLPTGLSPTVQPNW